MRQQRSAAGVLAGPLASTHAGQLSCRGERCLVAVGLLLGIGHRLLNGAEGIVQGIGARCLGGVVLGLPNLHRA